MMNEMKDGWGCFTIWEKIAILFSGIFFICIAVTVYYADLRSLTIWSVNFWEVIFEKNNLLLFYEYTAENIYGVPHEYMGCDILVCIPWAIWNFPLWLLQHLGIVSILQHPSLLIYSKFFLLVLLCGCIREVICIGKFFTTNIRHIYLCAMIFGTGFFTVNSVGCYGQNDIMIVYLILVAMRYVLQNEWIKFLLISAISIAFEPYFVFSYIAIILLKEKRIHYIFMYIISGLSIFCLQKIPFWNAPMYQESMSQGPAKTIISMLFENVMPLTPYMISCFLLFLFGGYLLAYFDEGKEDFDAKIVYYGLMSFCYYFVFVRSESYRPLYLYTFICLIMLIRPQLYRINLWIEFISSGCLMLLYMYQNANFYNCDWFILPSCTNNGIRLNYFVNEYLPNIQSHILMTVFVLCMGMLLIINNPRFKGSSKVLYLQSEKYLMLIRSCIYTLPYIGAVVLAYI